MGNENRQVYATLRAIDLASKLAEKIENDDVKG
jgi:hypothetical protein